MLATSNRLPSNDLINAVFFFNIFNWIRHVSATLKHKCKWWMGYCFGLIQPLHLPQCRTFHCVFPIWIFPTHPCSKWTIWENIYEQKPFIESSSLLVWFNFNWNIWKQSYRAVQCLSLWLSWDYSKQELPLWWLGIRIWIDKAACNTPSILISMWHRDRG